MIHVYPVGRLGNQLFEYAFARVIQINNPSQEIIWHWNILKEYGEEKDGWCNSLKHFNIVDINKTEKDVCLSLYQRIINKIYFLFHPKTNNLIKISNFQDIFEPFLGNSGLYYHGLKKYNYSFKHKGDIMISGSFEVVDYFNSYKETLVKEFIPKHDRLEKNLSLYEKIESSNSVCVSLRRGDFLEAKNKIHNVCTTEYFQKAITKMQELVPNCTFFFFSDDIHWVKENITMPLGYKCYYETGDDPVWEKLRLMYSCNHFIISNSTFSWWAQFLGRSCDKIVIAPNRWFNDDFVPSLYQKEWITIEV